MDFENFENLNPNYYSPSTQIQSTEYPYKPQYAQPILYQQPAQMNNFQYNQQQFPQQQQYNNYDNQANYTNYENMSNYNNVNGYNNNMSNPLMNNMQQQGNIMPQMNNYDPQMNYMKPQEIITPSPNKEEEEDPDFKPDDVVEEESDDDQNEGFLFIKKNLLSFMTF